ncbi:MAG: hypothetical protein COX62_02225 [Deltaproteobacteria bacterium CG_4_10_14_0_2_um_filter_43_8]|nr:MAG: hypothetical protein COV43_01875 [Deltaproteobacteria bacterium CG11_big_fil_rev_8_21_14_0_20_42_23]PJA21536.1 MAG: hypothetical protein COX62_02225 [Deltaproteobacteria bacterium CG_4_10_14_0_2_um_filter_43_8]PJC63983.1 MAG: hypothetical protein CO021_06640 [Deltaproteobacteria bacterium CG_4_9_14_0_2_um_filter_42_21]
MNFFSSTKKKLKSAAGFTLFELLVTLAVVALVVGLVVSQTNDLFDRDIKQASSKLAATIRYLYNKSATEGIYFRLILDIDERAYWIEATGDPYLLANPQAFAASGKSTASKSLLDEAKSKSLLQDEEIERIKPKTPSFDQVSERLLKPSKLPTSVYIKDVYVEHLQGPVDSGKASIAFFPNGYVEYAVINFRDEDDSLAYSLKTNPVSGSVKIEDRYRTLDDEE